MNKTTLPLAALLFLLGSSLAFSDKTDLKMAEKNYTEAIILDEGVKRTIHIPKDSNTTAKASTYESIQTLSKKEGVMVSFRKNNGLSIGVFETKYGLKLQEKLAIGYYIFENVSDKSDMEIVQDIIKNESAVKTVKPNWEKKNIPR
ncbi:MAG TPA: hypothetical protein PLH07_04040 [Sulfurovum sp.]|nr:MAG: hypothetical protein B7Y63_08715 [Sulfurovum sp. 35-42-20]OYZ25789.1 MAG: hypothetical protein B7Y23_03820 [Sulfurovum sp. 16-42-52]OYZ47823.1 MAG: hypothetical protein B7Y13_09330 [Sulfurovum sp. 24-42-9]OZA43453.1 MAG: hypothetical protein B7X80_09260 [Sulfurovum sp. 17-42-90]HQS72246.1 hypothetical protein [Sulfurovum sp.]